MALGTSLFLVAVGAILRYAITASVSGVNIQTVGLILMVVGILGLIVSFLQLALWSDRRRGDRTYARDRDAY